MKNKIFTLGAPRTGFTLLISIINELVLYKNKGYSKTNKRFITDSAIDMAGLYLKNEFLNFFKEKVNMDNYMYNGEFDLLVGGPKWVNTENKKESIVRKYVGLKDQGDFTFLMYLPKEALEYHQVVHSHYNPKSWIEDNYYDGFTKFASIRNPMGTLNSALFTINAITSEYIGKYMNDFDEEDLREKMALYKSTDLSMFEGLVKWLKGYMDEFIEVQANYNIVSWEDIISKPVDTIEHIANLLDIKIPNKDAQIIWNKLDHKNLLQHHNFNYRKGGGVIGEWKNRFTNHHLKILEEYGFNRYLKMFGYEEIKYFDEENYTDYQKKVSSYIDKGEICNEIEDKNLFIFNWNKSNISETSHKFDRFERTGNIKIERSALEDRSIAIDFARFAQPKIDFVHKLIDSYSHDFNFDVNKGKFYNKIIETLPTEDILKIDNRMEKIKKLKDLD